MSELAEKKDKGGEGAPAWVMTFADLMSLLMCFFVLLLSFSEMDLNKYKQIAGSMKEAFGVQRTVKVKEPPRGINIIAREFSPARPEPTPLNVVQQQTANNLQRYLKIDKITPELKSLIKMRSQQKSEKEEKVKKRAEEIKKQLDKEIKKGAVEIDTIKDRIIIRVREKSSFPSGRASLKSGFEPILQRIAQILESSPGQIIVAGHTDNVPISTYQFRSNWELSSARAVTVVHALQKLSKLPADRFLIEGHGETKPLAENNSAENRAKNRRVEIMLLEGNRDQESDKSLSVLDELIGDEDKGTDSTPKK